MISKASQTKILVVDDLPEWRGLLRRVLERQGYDVQTASSYDEAMATLGDQTFDVAILDVRLQEGVLENTDGLKIAAAIVDAQAPTSIIMISTYGTVTIVREAFRHHRVLDFIDKAEFETSQFLEIVEIGIQQARIRREGA